MLKEDLVVHLGDIQAIRMSGITESGNNIKGLATYRPMAVINFIFGFDDEFLNSIKSFAIALAFGLDDGIHSSIKIVVA